MPVLRRTIGHVAPTIAPPALVGDDVPAAPMSRLVFSLIVASQIAGCGRSEPTPSTRASGTASVSSTAQPVTPAASGSAGVVGFAGTYESTEGKATLTQSGFDVTIHYAAGHADCDVAGNTLTCTWHEGSDYGAARLTRVDGGKLLGTWGVGKSSTSGGEWTFVPAP